jgi:hypothetical protein
MIVAAVVMPLFDHSLRVAPAVLVPVVLYVYPVRLVYPSILTPGCTSWATICG